MKLSPSQALSEYGQVIFPSLAAIIGLAAITSQWVENHRLRGEVEKLNGERNASVQAIQGEIKKSEEKNRAYVKDLNRWIEGMNQYATQINADIGATRQSALEAKDQRNAQNIVAMFQAGQAAGIEWPTGTKEGKMQAVVMGGSPITGAFAGKIFKVPNLSASDLAGAAKFVALEGDDLVYARPAETPHQATVAGAGEQPGFPLMPKLPEP